MPLFGDVALWLPELLSVVAGVLPVVPMLEVDDDVAPLWPETSVLVLPGCWSFTWVLPFGPVLGTVLGSPGLAAPLSFRLGTGIVDVVPFCSVPGLVVVLLLSAPDAELWA